MLSYEYRREVGDRFDVACDEIGFELALAMQIAAVLQRIERRGFTEANAGRLVVESLKDAMLERTIAKPSFPAQQKQDKDRIKELERMLEEIESIARSA